MASGALQDAPRHPKTSQDTFKRLQDAPKRPQDASKKPQKASKIARIPLQMALRLPPEPLGTQNDLQDSQKRLPRAPNPSKVAESSLFSAIRHRHLLSAGGWRQGRLRH